MGGLALEAANFRAEEDKVDHDIRLQRLGACKQRQHDWLANKKGKLFSWIKDQGSKPVASTAVSTLHEEPNIEGDPGHYVGEDDGLGEGEGAAPQALHK